MAAPRDKKKFALWLYPETLEKVNELYRKDDCTSRSQFVEKAIQFYVGYLTAEDKSNYLPNMFLSAMKSISAESDNRQNRMMFKYAVEMAMIMNLLAAYYDVDRESLRKLRDECVKEVKKLNGNFTFNDALDWQNS